MQRLFSTARWLPCRLRSQCSFRYDQTGTADPDAVPGR
jgi:hypothetical protein